MTEVGDARKRRLEGERVAGDAVAEVLAAHPCGAAAVSGQHVECDCGERLCVPVGATTGGTFRAHVAAQIAPLLDQARAEGAAEAETARRARDAAIKAADWNRAERDRLRAAVEALADEWEQLAREDDEFGIPGQLPVWNVADRVRAVLADADNEAGA